MQPKALSLACWCQAHQAASHLPLWLCYFATLSVIGQNAYPVFCLPQSHLPTGSLLGVHQPYWQPFRYTNHTASWLQHVSSRRCPLRLHHMPRLVMANQQRKQTSLLLTCRVLRFVHQLRQRVKPRVLEGSVNSGMLGTSGRALGCPNGVSMISIRKAKRLRQLNRARRGNQRRPKWPRLSPGVQRPFAGASATPTVTGNDALLQ